MTAIHASTVFPALVGTPRQVRSQLDKFNANKVIVLSADQVDDQHASLIAQGLAGIMPLIDTVLREQNHRALEALISAFVPKVPPTPNLAKEAQMQARARTAVLEGAEWISAVKLAELAGLSDVNPSAQPNKWKRQRKIFAIQHNGVDYFPGYGLDPEAGWRPRKTLKAVLEVFDDDKDGWGLARWFLSANSFLGGRRPQDVLATDPEQVVAAARDEMEEIAHA